MLYDSALDLLLLKEKRVKENTDKMSFLIRSPQGTDENRITVNHVRYGGYKAEKVLELSSCGYV